MTVDSLLIDISPWSPQRPADWRVLEQAGQPWVGGVLKVSEGRYAYDDWFAPHWRALGATGLLRGCYAFLRLKDPAAPQAEALVRAVERAGGWGSNDLHPWLDVEWSRANDGVTREQIEDCVSTVAAEVGRLTGRDCTLYAGSWLRAMRVTSRMGCRWLTYPAYTSSLMQEWYETIGWDRDSLIWWQFAGVDRDGVHCELAGYPRTTPIGDADINVLTLPGGASRLLSLLWAEKP